MPVDISGLGFHKQETSALKSPGQVMDRTSAQIIVMSRSYIPVPGSLTKISSNFVVVKSPVPAHEIVPRPDAISQVCTQCLQLTALKPAVPGSDEILVLQHQGQVVRADGNRNLILNGIGLASVSCRPTPVELFQG